MLRKLFIDHPAAVNESYLEHIGHANRFGIRMVLGGLACMVHGLIPGLFVTTGSRTVEALHDRMVRNRVRNAAPTRARRNV
jgi:hypothetical protein